MVTLSSGARMAMQASERLAFAVRSSFTTVKICSDHPRITTWSVSTTRERPLRSSSSRFSRPVVRTPMRALTRKMPPMVTRNMTSRKPHPASPPMVPASRVRMRLSQAPSTNPGGVSPSGAMPKREMASAPPRMTTREARPSPSRRAPEPRAMRLSNQ